MCTVLPQCFGAGPEEPHHLAGVGAAMHITVMYRTVPVKIAEGAGVTSF
jgi:hypothetical protein